MKLLLASQEGLAKRQLIGLATRHRPGFAGATATAERIKTMRTVRKWCALAIGIWVLVTSPSDIVKTLHFAGTLDLASADDAIMARVLIPALLFLRLATIWVLLRVGWGAISHSRSKVRRFKPGPLSDFSDGGYPQRRKSWTR